MRKKKTFEYTSYFAAEFNGFLQYRISGGSNGLEERRVLKSLDDYLIQSGMVKKKLDGIIVDAWINSLNVGGNTKAHYVSVYRQFAHYLTGLGYKAYIPPPLQIKRNYTPYDLHPVVAFQLYRELKYLADYSRRFYRSP